MSKLVVAAEASPLFGNFLMVVSVSEEASGKPVKKLGKTNFGIYQMASLNHASKKKRVINKVKEGPDGIYTITLKPWQYQPQLPPGHYVFAVMATVHQLVVQKADGSDSSVTELKKATRAKIKTKPIKWGQTVATGDLPPYGIWIK